MVSQTTAENLRFEKALLQAQSEASPDGILVVSREGRILSHNRRFAEMWGIPADVLALRSDAAALDAVRRLLADPDEFMAKVAHLYAHPDEVSREEIRLIDRRVFDRYSTPIPGPDGAHYGRIWFFRDATEQKHAEAARIQLAEERAARDAALERSARLRALHEAALAIAGPINAAPDAVARLLTQIVASAVAALGGRDGRLVLAEDPAWSELVIGDDPATGPVVLDHTGRLRRAPQRRDGATEHVLATGELVWVSDIRAPERFGPYDQLAEVGIRALVMAPLRTAGSVLGVLGITFNETRAPETEDREVLELFAAHGAAALQRARLAYADQQLASQRAELARREAEAAALRELDRLKTELLQTVSHELRTPISVIHGYAQLLERRGGESAGPAARIASGSAQLTRLVEDLVDFAQLERGAMRLRVESFDLVPVMRELVSELRQRDETLRLSESLPDRLPVRADRERVAQVVSNLLENAAKYAPGSEISVCASAGHERDGTAYARVEVQDSGPGIPEAEQNRVWERFYRGSQVRALNLAGGTGIGLAVVKGLVEAQGGRVGLRSAPGSGSCFWFELPSERG